jgi:transcriptional regulator
VKVSASTGGNLVFAKESGLLQGTVELLVLKTLSWGPMHGYGIASWIESATGDVLRVEEGSLYPALYRMTRKGWILGKWGTTENNRRAKYYHLTSEGRRQFNEQTTGWQKFASAVSQAVTTTRAPSWAR